MTKMTCTLNNVLIHPTNALLIADATFSDGHQCRVTYRPGTVVVMRRVGTWTDGDPKWQANDRASNDRVLAVHDAAAPIYQAEVAKAHEAEAARQAESAARDREANEYFLKCEAGPVLYAALVAVRDGVRDDSPEMWQQVDDAIAAAEGDGRREYHVGTPEAHYLQDVWATSPEQAACKFAYRNRNADGMTMRPGEVDVFTERQPFRYLKFKDDAELSRELDRLEKTGTVPGSDQDKARNAQIEAIRAIFRDREMGCARP